VTPNTQTTPISTFYVASDIFVVDEDFKFGVHIDHSKSKPTDDKMSLKRSVVTIWTDWHTNRWDRWLWYTKSAYAHTVWIMSNVVTII